MLKAVAVVGARLGSARLPGKHLLDLAGRPLIARVFERLDRVPELHAAVLATTADAVNAPLVAWARDAGRAVTAYEGDVNDLMGRVDAVVRQYEAEVVVYICGDCPLLEPTFISRALQAMAAAPEAGFVDVAPGPGTLIHQGIDIYGIAFWRRVLAASVTPSEREHVGSARFPLLADTPRVRVSEPDVFFTRPRRISVDTPSDYSMMQTLYSRWYAAHGADEIVSLAWVVAELDRDADLAAINAAVHQKTTAEVSLPVLCVCAAGAAVGLGHLRRMLAVTRALVDGHGAGVRLLIEGPPVDLGAPLLYPHRFVDAWRPALAEAVAEKTPHAVVWDLPRGHVTEADRPLVADLAAAGVRVIGIDFSLPFPDLWTYHHVPSFYLDPALGLPRTGYGWDHYLLEAPSAPASARRGVLVLTGGSDAYGLGAVWPALLDAALPAGTPVHWVRGPYAPAPHVPAAARAAWTVHHHPDDLAGLRARAQAALCVYGVSLFECLASGLATVCWAPDRLEMRDEWAAFDREGLAVRVSRAEDAPGALAALWADAPRRTALAEAATARMGHAGPALCARRILGDTRD